MDVVTNQLQGYNQPLSHGHSASYNHMDFNCNIVYQVNNTQEMDIPFDSAVTRSRVELHQQNFSVSVNFFEYVIAFHI